MAGVGEIDDHAQRLHAADGLPAERRQATLSDAMHRPSHVVIEEMGQTGHSEAGGVEHIKIFDLALEIVQALDRQHSATTKSPFLRSASRRSMSDGVVISRSCPARLRSKVLQFSACHHERWSREVHVLGGCRSITARLVIVSLSAPLES